MDEWRQVFDKIILSYNKGIICAPEVHRLIERAIPDEVAPKDWVPLLPVHLKELLIAWLKRRPSSPWGWGRTYDFNCEKNESDARKWSSELIEKRKRIDALRDYFTKIGINVDFAEPGPPIELTFRQILELADTSDSRELSLRVAKHIYGWPESPSPWGTAYDDLFLLNGTPNLCGYAGKLVEQLWGVLNDLHPWIYRDNQFRAKGWADVCLLEYRWRDYEFRQPLEAVSEPSVAVLREENSTKIPLHRKYDTATQNFKTDLDDLCHAIEFGRNFRIGAVNYQTALCKALLVAKKCRQVDLGPDGEAID